MTDENIVSKVRFDLWAVLGLLIALGGICVGYLNAEQVKTKEKQQAVIERVTKIETQYCYIIERLDGLKASSERTADKVDALKSEIRGRKISVSDLKWR